MQSVYFIGTKLIVVSVYVYFDCIIANRKNAYKMAQDAQC